MSVDLSTKYLGLDLRSPVVASSCPLTGDLVSLQKIADAGAGAVVLPSLFEEQLQHAAPGLPGGQANTEIESYNLGPDGYLRTIELARKCVDIPVVASLNGSTSGGWTRFARLIEQAGADAIELNLFYVVSAADVTSYEVEQRCVDVVASVCSVTSCPIAVKLSPYVTALPQFVSRLINAGAKGLSLFNRLLEPAFDIETLEVEPHLQFSHASDLRLPLRWLAILYGRFDVSLAATSGIRDPDGAVKALLAGADVVMLASALMAYGPEHLEVIHDGLREWMGRKGIASVNAMQGLMSQKNALDPQVFERANYTKTLSSFHREGGPGGTGADALC